MKVLAPSWITETQNPDDKLFICFMYSLALEHGFNTAYYMHNGDVGVFFKDKGNIYPGNPTILQSTLKWIQIGKINKNQFLIHFMHTKHKQIEWEITCDKHKAMWIYLEALKNNDAIFYKKHLGAEQLWRKHRLPSQYRQWLADR